MREVTQKKLKEEFERRIVFRTQDRAGHHVVLECGHYVIQAIGVGTDLGDNFRCSQCVNYFVKHKRDLPRVYRLVTHPDDCNCHGTNVSLIGPGGPTATHIITWLQFDANRGRVGECVMDLNEAYGHGFLAGAKEALQTHG